MGICRQMIVHRREQEPRGSSMPPHPMLASRPIPASMLQVKLLELQVDRFNHEPERPEVECRDRRMKGWLLV